VKLNAKLNAELNAKSFCPRNCSIRRHPDTIRTLLGRYWVLMPLHAVACRCCGATRTRLVGRGARGRKFAGARLKPELDGGQLYRCPRCDLLMRHPLLSAAQYLSLYAPSAGDHWTRAALRPDQQRVCAYLQQLLPKGGTVLDVGCSSGDLLHALGARYTKYGVEPSADACTRAQALGVQVLSATVEGLAERLVHDDLKFDVITAVDVIEHVPNPLAFLQALAPHLRAGGRIIVSTGNSRTWAWRLCGPAYYYAHYFEHVSFISERWCRYVAQQGLQAEVLHARFRYDTAVQLGVTARLQMVWRFVGNALLSAVEQTLLLHLPTAARRLGLRVMVGQPGLFADHMMVSFSGPQQAPKR
jgi:2-polyprenyl-3-methyl-5-hydroxy-6-metoxy-1,4-benzoquinol methylase